VTGPVVARAGSGQDAQGLQHPLAKLTIAGDHDVITGTFTSASPRGAS